MRRIFCIFLIFCLFLDTTFFVFAKEVSSSTVQKTADNKSIDDFDQELNLGPKEFLRDTAIYYGSIWIFRLFYVRNKNDRIFDTSLGDWWDNITEAPETDDGDSFFTNYVVHPFSGMMSYLYYREMGHNFWGAALGSVVQSTLFEYTIEGLVETPSLPDLISTPGVGVPLGFIVEKGSDWLVDRDNIIAKSAGRILNPMGNVVKDRNVVLFNPLTSRFEYSGSFNTSTPPAKRKSLDLGYPIFFESAIPKGYFEGFLEVANLDESLNNGEIFMYHVKAEFPSENYLYSLYIRVSQAGVNNIGELDGDNVRDGFEFANLLLGSKAVLYKTKNSVLTAGFETIFPTAYKDNIDRLESIVENYRRDFPIYLRKTYTFTPYLSASYWKNWLSIQGSFGTDFITRARRLEGDSFEFRLKYSAAVGINFPVAYNPIVFTEFNGYSLLTADSFDKTDLFVTTGLRFGNRFSPGFAIQIPISGPTDDISKFSYMVDFRINF